MAKSVKENYALTFFDTVMSMAFPLITLPYVTRILSPDSIGHVYFYLNILSYITLLTALGIPLYGVREIAKNRNDLEKCNHMALELLILHLILTAVGYLLVFVLCVSAGKIREDIPLFAVLSISLFFTTIGVSWFFQAVEDFRYITIRSLLVKILSLILLFSLVRSRDDVIWYGFVLVCGSVGNNLFNLFRLRKYLRRTDFKRELNPFKHVRPASKVFLLNLTVGIYTQLSVFLLGFLQSDAAVGYYTMAQKIVSILNSIVLALTTVLLPRLSNFVGNRQLDDFKALGNKSLSFSLAISLPICTGLIVLAKPLIIVLFGEAYEPSIIVLMIWAPVLVIIGLSQLYGKSLLYSTGHEMIMTFCTLIGMIVYLIVAIPGVIYFSIVGATVGSLCAELAVTGSMMFWGRNSHPCTVFRKDNLVYLVASLMMAFIIFIGLRFVDDFIVQLVVGIFLGFLTYCIILGISHDPFYKELINYIRSYGRKS